MSSQKKQNFGEAAREVFAELFLAWRATATNVEEVFKAAMFSSRTVESCQAGTVDDRVLARAVRYHGENPPDIQEWVFQRAKTQFKESYGLYKEAAEFSYNSFMQAVGQMVQETCPEAKNPIGYFSVKYLGKDDHRPLMTWMKKETVMMSTNVYLVLKTLSDWNENRLSPVDKPVESVAEKSPAKDSSRPSKVPKVLEQKPKPVEKDLAKAIADPAAMPNIPEVKYQAERGRRKLVDFVVTMMNSVNYLIQENGISPKDVYDSDRGSLRTAIRKIFERCGIKADFPEPPERQTGLEPVTAADFASMGLRSSKKKGN